MNFDLSKIENITVEGWENEYKIGIKDIDNQHKFFFKIIEDAKILLNNSDDKEHVKKLFSEIVLYTKFHFENEENFMKEINYPGLEKQQQSHIFFIKELGSYIKKINTDKEIIPHVLVFLNNWLKVHIIKEDIEIKKFLSEIKK